LKKEKPPNRLFKIEKVVERLLGARVSELEMDESVASTRVNVLYLSELNVVDICRRP
jgi:hypothetical protein